MIAAYTSSLNVVPVVASGNGVRGQAVVDIGSGFAVATTANRASAGGELHGIALENWTTLGPQFQVCTSGYVAKEIIGTLSGSGHYVNVDANGNLVRSTTVTSDTVGNFLTNGAINVDLECQFRTATTASTDGTVNVTLTGTVSAGQWVCSANDPTDNTKVALVTATNIANARGIRGVMMESGTVGQTKKMAAPGATVSASIMGITSASTADAIVVSLTTSLGSRVTYPAQTDWIGGFCDKQGNTVVRPMILGERREYSLLEFPGADPTGATDSSPALQLALNTLPNDSTLYVPMVNYFRLSTPVYYSDDDAGGKKNGIHIKGEGGQSHTGGRYHFRAAMTRKHGTLASITARTNGSPGSGDFHTTITLDASSGVTAATKSRWMGTWLDVWNCATDGNQGSHIIVDVPSDDTVRVSNQNVGSAGTDANNTAICWAVDEPLIDIRARDTHFENISFGCIGAARFGCFVQITHPNGAHPSAVLKNKFSGCHFETDTWGSSGSMKDCVWVARNMLPQSNTNTPAWRGLNGAGEFQVGTPNQIDTIVWEKCIFNGARRAGVAFWSSTAQTKECRFDECSFGGANVTPMQYGIAVPKDARASSPDWSPYGHAHWDVYKGSFADIKDYWIQIGGYGSSTFNVVGCYGESMHGALSAPTTAAYQPINWKSNSLSTIITSLHKSGAWIKTNGCGPLVIDGGYMTITGGDGNAAHIELIAAPTTIENCVSITNWNLHGRSDYTVKRATRISRLRGPYKFAGTERLAFKVDGAARVEVVCSQANFNSACVVTVDLNEVEPWMVAALINANISGAAAWGDGDGSTLRVASATLTASGSIESVAPSVGTDANTLIAFGAGASSNIGTQSQLSKDTSGFIDWGFATGTASTTRVNFRGNSYTDTSNTGLALEDLPDKTYNGTLGKKTIENVRGISQTSGIPPKNFWCETPHVGGGTTFKWDSGSTPVWATEGDASYKIFGYPVGYSGGVPAAGYDEIVSISYATGGPTITTAADPGGGVTVTWHLELRR